MRLFLIMIVVGLGTTGHVVSAAALRELSGRWIRIVTDLPPGSVADTLPESFDAAVPRWLRFWQVPPTRIDHWRVTMYVMDQKEDFKRRGFIPDTLPDFPNGYTVGNKAWVIAKPSDYYTRHLVLHEGVHSLAFHLHNGAGPTWFMEGTAEFLATHHGRGSDIQLPVVPANRDRVPLWGRLKIIDQSRTTGHSLSLASVMRYSNRLFRSAEPYAWSWATVLLMDMYPESRRELIAAASRGGDRSKNFTQTLRRNLGRRWPLLQTRWRILIDEIDYGYDRQRNAVALDFASPTWNRLTTEMKVNADQGWQAAPVRIPADTKIRLTASGRYTLANKPKPWVCEPQGVTIRYYRGNPLGMVLATLLPTQPTPRAQIRPLKIVAVGREKTLQTVSECWLLLRIGDLPSELADNTGRATVKIALDEH